MRPVVLSMHYLALKRLLSAARRILNEGDARKWLERYVPSRLLHRMLSGQHPLSSSFLPAEGLQACKFYEASLQEDGVSVSHEPDGERSFKASHKIKWSPEQELKTSKDNLHKSKKPEVEE
ncbi:unnamed protein product [Sphagnum jensenii]|uniref:Uncharacterized protein n=1 Tax=Sphagnum jensenii TaxID=128206 RepID=A0ABP1B056_9BRYO